MSSQKSESIIKASLTAFEVFSLDLKMILGKRSLLTDREKFSMIAAV
jgi:hypothetical protein